MIISEHIEATLSEPRLVYKAKRSRNLDSPSLNLFL